MIRSIIKRSGATEPFYPEKINQWGVWAADTLGSHVDWSMVVLDTVRELPEVCTSQQLQEKLIQTCLDYDTWSYNRMAGRLYAPYLYKHVFGDNMPTVQELHKKLQAVGLMVAMNYSDAEYAEVEAMIDHSLDFKATHYELHHIRSKYGIKNRVKGIDYETQQYTYMRMAMALAEDQPADRRMYDLAKWYEHLSHKRLNAPTPNYVNLGTKLRGYASCCVYTTNDNAKSLAIGDHIAYTMSYMSAGIGSHVNTRSIGDPVRGGVIEHQGRLPYYRSLVGAVKANLQNGRSGACTVYYSGFDPEVTVISQLKNPMSTEDKKIRGIDYNMGSNRLFARKVARNEEIFLFNVYTAPDLYQAMYSGDDSEFERLYAQYEADPMFNKTYISAREVLITVQSEAFETGRAYLHFPQEMNRHTPFKCPIYSSNLCAEIAIPTKGYNDMQDLYSDEDHGRGEIGLCSLAAMALVAITSDEMYAEVAYYALLMIDKCIHMGEYVFPHLGITAKGRMSAGVGIVDLAHLMARNNLKYSTVEGKQFIHTVAEKHMYHLIEASLKLSKELGVAPWMDKTKWPDGWLPIDTYNKNVDSIADFELKYDWEDLRTRVVENGGIRNSVLVAYMPAEASSKASGTTNSIYPIRDISLIKTDNSTKIYWAAPHGEELDANYERAWDVPTLDMIQVYAIFQKFTDQAISSDLWRKMIDNAKVPTSDMIKEYIPLVKYGIKTRYYVNSKTSSGNDLNAREVACASGTCDV